MFRIFGIVMIGLLALLVLVGCDDEEGPFVLSEHLSDEARALVDGGTLSGYHEQLRDYHWVVREDIHSGYFNRTFYTDSEPVIRGSFICMEGNVVIMKKQNVPGYWMRPYDYCINTSEGSYEIIRQHAHEGG